MRMQTPRICMDAAARPHRRRWRRTFQPRFHGLRSSNNYSVRGLWARCRKAQAVRWAVGIDMPETRAMMSFLHHHRSLCSPSSHPNNSSAWPPRRAVYETSITHWLQVDPQRPTLIQSLGDDS
ncbi:hypothetical protein U9M48_038886 [Paspalum notatum var. saurae]|uniref:Uncharacterized protein n=1 Tax=Paspalum notatum var. saurae TaxID=547442 RepID=A0AAQ3UIH4_PASNO